MFSLGEKMEFLVGNGPFSTPVGQRVERATSGTLQSDDWGLNMEICDIINETDEGPRDAIKAIKKRIVGNKNFREIMLALTVLEACVKNCGHRLHVLVASQEFIEGVLVRAILPKYNPPTALHDRVLSLIQSWADAFRSSPSLAGVVCVYDDLRRRGLEFPMTDLDALSPIHTPNRSIPENRTPDAIPAAAPTPESRPEAPSSVPTQSSSPAVLSSEGPASLSAEQEQKLRSELALVKGNLTVMTELLNEIIPGQSQQDDTELLQQLYLVCKSMQTRVVELIPQLMDEGFIEELLVVNDDLNNAFIRYERFDRLNKAQNTQQSSTTSQSPVSHTQPAIITTTSQPAIITTTSQPAIITTTSQPAVSNTCVSLPQAADHIVTPSVNICLAEEEGEFDMFAHTRGSSLAEQRKSVRYEDPGAMEGLAGALDTRLQVTGGTAPAQKSLQNDVCKSGDMEGQSSVSEGVSSAEFDQFLKDRAKASDQGGQAIRSVPPSTSRPPPPQSTRQQERSDQLFSL
ncbi:target of Myb1 membrane trafficking protein-like isoform X2 [Pungitius pungitius]|uniref:target of Myb1 membrane trafficking protein-like isoform X2 n=1 Tax=Pungitius pungitius TaxID=134920 RepID=UPI002E0D2CEC